MNVTITKDSVSGCFRVAGNLCYANVVKSARLGCGVIDKQPEVVFDLQDVIIDDDAVLALLINLIRYAKKEQKTIHFSHIPEKILDMAKVSGLIELLPILSS
ncbi:MAG: hypothetical protein A2X78_04680 [Gammaproteobacteria bacterium GWE2_37_16]|nr:MAG: hypothetical protein A2X78_04680 [Gammaproteobacteria bacterium GWE2_37_16]